MEVKAKEEIKDELARLTESTLSCSSNSEVDIALLTISVELKAMLKVLIDIRDALIYNIKDFS